MNTPAFVSMSEDQEKQISEQTAAIKDLFKSKQIDSDLYHKCMVCIAYEWAVANQMDKASAILQGIPAVYFQAKQGPQMVEDPNFAYLAYTTALLMVQGGYIHLGPKQLATNVPAAMA